MIVGSSQQAVGRRPVIIVIALILMGNSVETAKTLCLYGGPSLLAVYEKVCGYVLHRSPMSRYAFIHLFGSSVQPAALAICYLLLSAVSYLKYLISSIISQISNIIWYLKYHISNIISQISNLGQNILLVYRWSHLIFVHHIGPAKVSYFVW